MIIKPEIIVTPDMPTIRFREPRENVELDKQIPAILHAQGWGCGTYFHVQFMNHEKTKIFIHGLFLVTNVMESLKTTGSDYAPNTMAVVSYVYNQIGDWYYFNGSDLVKEESSEKVVKWNPGKKVHEVLVDEEVVFFSADKTEAVEFSKAA